MWHFSSQFVSVALLQTCLRKQHFNTISFLLLKHLVAVCCCVSISFQILWKHIRSVQSHLFSICCLPVAEFRNLLQQKLIWVFYFQYTSTYEIRVENPSKYFNIYSIDVVGVKAWGPHLIAQITGPPSTFLCSYTCQWCKSTADVWASSRMVRNLGHRELHSDLCNFKQRWLPLRKFKLNSRSCNVGSFWEF